MHRYLWARRLREGKLPNSWKNASVIITHKKSDTAEIKKIQTDKLAIPITYTRCSLSDHAYRMQRMLDRHQPIEQAGFRSGFSTTDHIQVISQLQEKADEYKILL